jgi:hypothetical protein
VRLWDRRIGAVVAVIVLAAAPAARAGCAARCATPGQPIAPRHAVDVPDATMGTSHQHAHHHGAQAHTTPTPAAAAIAGDTRCGAANGRACVVIRDSAGAPPGRVVQDGEAVAVDATAAGLLSPPAVARPWRRTPPIRPPGPTAALLPLRI